MDARVASSSTSRSRISALRLPRLVAAVSQRVWVSAIYLGKYRSEFAVSDCHEDEEWVALTPPVAVSVSKLLAIEF